MSRNDVLAKPIASYAERKRRIEAEVLPANIYSLLELACAEAGDRPAIDFFETGEVLTYRQLAEAVYRLANGMMSAGIAKGTHVGVMMPNIMAFPITWLALGCLGAVMVPINIGYMPRELDCVLKTSNATWLFIHETCLPALERVEGGRATVRNRVVVGNATGDDRSWHSLSAGQSSNFTAPEPVGLPDLLNIQFTSGTTGFPKGAMLSQEYWLVCGKQNAFRDGRRYERILASTPFFYMDPQWQLLMALYQRGTLFVAKRQSASQYMEWVRKYHIQFGLFPEVAFKQPPNRRDRENEIIRVNIYGVSKGLHAAIEERFNFVAREVFGMTETGTGLFMPIEAVDMVGSGSCGIPAPFREARLVDDKGQPVPRGAVGELLIRGRGILSGYFNNPEATEKAFLGDWFRTGDLFRQDERGYFTIVGRLKDMVRRAGENIAAREVEAAIVALAEVAEAAVVPVPDETRGEEAKAYVVLQDGVPADEGTLSRIIAHCTGRLAGFKIPRYYEFKTSLPKTASGKIAKPLLLTEKPDLRTGSFDRAIGRWL
jgi:acyl-CoA synthetase (AMP-forming)/AMP-acid ligase II